MRLKDKVAIITGGARGIGLAIARRFSEEGAHVIIADVLEEEGRDACADIGHAMFVACDVSDKEQVDKLVDETLRAQGHIDILVNCAAILRSASVLDLTEDDFDRVIAVNLKGSFLTSQAVARQMVHANRGGAIINLSSINALVALPAALPYNVSKGGVAQLTRVMGIALADKGIRVNAIGPGSINTEMLRIAMEGDSDARQQVLSRTPIGRLGEVEEIASIAVFLASDDASYIVGETIYADGGRLALNYTVPVSDEQSGDEQ
ncbi:SDR family oxidoreductase [Gammaproteobacteria bacterium]|nr:SDR family oxidoreductase [Gammaproteobacteria bacterium]